MLVIPDSLVITLYHSLNETSLIPVSEILAVPATAEPVWDGAGPVARIPEPPYIMFGFGWLRDFAGCGYEDTCRMAARIGAHLAAMDGNWPSGEVHVRGYPVIDARFDFLAAASRIEPDDAEMARRKAFPAGLLTGHPRAAELLGQFGEGA